MENVEHLAQKQPHNIPRTLGTVSVITLEGEYRKVVNDIVYDVNLIFGVMDYISNDDGFRVF